VLVLLLVADKIALIQEKRLFESVEVGSDVSAGVSDVEFW
jgi:hypothetical protein